MADLLDQSGGALRDAERQAASPMGRDEAAQLRSTSSGIEAGLRRQVPALSLDLLSLFVKIAESGTIASASYSLGLSASRASRKLQDMEQILSVRLFERSTRSLRLTDAGSIALQWARETLTSFNALSAALDSSTGKPTGCLRLAVNHYVAHAYLPAIIERYAQLYPGVDIEIRATDRSVDLIAEGLDVAIYSGPEVPNSYIGVRVGTHRRVVCASPAYLECHGEPKLPSELREHRILVHGTAESLSWGFRYDGGVTVESIKPYVTADTHMMLRDLARRGLGIARLGHLLVEPDLRSGRLCEVLTEYRSIYETEEHVPSIWVLYPSKQLPFRVRAFVDLAVSLLNNRRHPY